MGDTGDGSVGDDAGEAAPTAGDGADRGADGPDAAGEGADDGGEAEDVAALRRRVEEEYDFDDFGPSDMARMSAEEWEAAFDADSWIVGEELLDRVERDLKARIASRDVFAALDRASEGGEPRLAAWSDEGYAVVAPDGTVEGSGTVLRDVKASVALCSMESYDVAEPPANHELPDPADVPEGTGELGNLMLQVVAAVQLLAGLGLTVAWLSGRTVTIVAPVAALAFLLVGVFLLALVANARLSDRFRAAEFRDRLRAVDEAGPERPDFLPPSAEDSGAAGTTDGAADLSPASGASTADEGTADEGTADDGTADDGGASDGAVRR